MRMVRFGVIHEKSAISQTVRQYERLRLANDWNPSNDIDWQLKSNLSEGKRATSLALVQQGSYTEEVGMLVAARLIEMVDDLPTRYCLAVQVADEARHSEVFARYTDAWETRFSGQATSPQKPMALLNDLLATSNTLELFTLHTMLEGLAMDQFGLLTTAFDGDALGQIYSFIRKDEARHVAMGTDFLKSALRRIEPDEARSILNKCRAELFAIANVDDSVFVEMAKLTGRSSDDLNQWMTGRVNTRFAALHSQLKEYET